MGTYHWVHFTCDISHVTYCMVRKWYDGKVLTSSDTIKATAGAPDIIRYESLKAIPVIIHIFACNCFAFVPSCWTPYPHPTWLAYVTRSACHRKSNLATTLIVWYTLPIAKYPKNVQKISRRLRNIDFAHGYLAILHILGHCCCCALSYFTL